MRICIVMLCVIMQCIAIKAMEDISSEEQEILARITQVERVTHPYEYDALSYEASLNNGGKIFADKYEGEFKTQIEVYYNKRYLSPACFSAIDTKYKNGTITSDPQ